MKKLELIDKRKQAIASIDSIVEAGKKETRKLTPEEEKQIGDLKAEIRSYDEELEKINNPKPNDPQKRNATMRKEASIVRLINETLDGRSYSDEDVEIIESGRRMLEESGLKPSGLTLPLSLRAITATDDQEVIATEVGGIIDALRANLVLSAAGATILTGLVGNVKFPVYKGNTASWEGENVTATDGSNGFDGLPLSPKRLVATIKVSKQLLMQSTPDVEVFLRNAIVQAIANKLEATCFGAAAGTATMPEGVIKTLGGNVTDVTGLIINGTATFKNVVKLESTVDGANGMANQPVYITNAAGRGILKTTAIATGNPKMICELGEVNGYKLLATNNVPTMVSNAEQALLFGDFSKLIVGQWGAMNIEIENAPRENAVYLTINSFWDYGMAQKGAFAVGSIKA